MFLDCARGALQRHEEKDSKTLWKKHNEMHECCHKSKTNILSCFAFTKMSRNQYRSLVVWGKEGKEIEDGNYQKKNGNIRILKSRVEKII